MFVHVNRNEVNNAIDTVIPSYYSYIYELTSLCFHIKYIVAQA